MRSILRHIFLIIKEIIFIKFLVFYILFEKKTNLKEKKVIFFGPPILSIKYIIQACKLITPQAASFVKYFYPINKKSDFDYVTRNPFIFLTQIKKHNIYLNYYDSIDNFFGPISKHLFIFYKKIKGKKLVVMPYGSDAWLYSKVQNYLLRHALNIDYTIHGLNEKKIEKRYFWLNKAADFRIAIVAHVMTLSAWDALPVLYYPINTERIAKIKNDKYKTFTIIHTPNHRGFKGTEFLIEAVKQLQDEGHEIDLKLVEKAENYKVLEELSRSHLLVEQLVVGYALSALEGMASGLPVMSNLGFESCELLRTYSYLGECPIVNTKLEIEDIKEKILYVIKNQEELSRKSLEYVTKYHSYKANAIFWNKVFESLEIGKSMINYFHPIVGEYNKDYLNYT